MQSYTYLGPQGTFTEMALLQVPGVDKANRVPSTSAAAALVKVRSGEVDAAMLPIENSVEGGVSATLDAIATGQELRIIREVIVPVSFVFAARPGVELSEVKRVGTHPHAWAQTRIWAGVNIPEAEYVPATSTAAAAHELSVPVPAYEAAICAKLVAQQLGLEILVEGIEDNVGAVTRFVLVSRPGPLPAATGSDKTTVAIPLPADHPGALMEILDQFSSRGVNLSRIESRPTGQFLGHYFFSVDAEGHIANSRMADALRALHRLSPQIRFMGSYPRADSLYPTVPRHTTDDAFDSAQLWLDDLLADE
ncbi:prephenate dehydratase [Renibacterium salmoninarum ATCC 33209]|uniref:Prephenate dehydratase n=1 Tax=Renibacterium salmoninarum (strain ATCC 33209 / DSM 20767 / JCM 11484 / NBRC 15589 / NCIMB 2235) TaxID=288705 RepID=A9WUS4_RENSM|nr:prephenate dehydratase [Renibacterium salmoninarum]ABY24945.1 prephenate dehydratase [Renibacterium salmoninarum ATCC 33209]